MKTSDKFTLVRIIFAPVNLLIYFIPIWTKGFFSSASIFVLIPLLILVEFTDYLDGHYARKHNVVSDFGKVFDPFADVILHMTTFCCLMFTSSAGGKSYMPPIIFVLLMYREMSMTFIRMGAAQKGTAIAAKKGGKLKTVVYILSGFYGLLLELIARNNFGISAGSFEIMRYVAVALFCLCLVLSYISFFDYIVSFKSILKSE